MWPVCNHIARTDPGKATFLLSYGGPTQWYESEREAGDYAVMFWYSSAWGRRSTPIKSKTLKRALSMVYQIRDVIGDREPTATDLRRALRVHRGAK